MDAGARREELPAAALRWTCDLTGLEFETTDALIPCDEILGQDRALRAIRLGLAVARPGYNIFLVGLSGTGRTTTIKCLLEEMDHRDGAPEDIIYVNNFKDPDAPRAVSLPAGKGHLFGEDMAELVDQLRKSIPSVFESDDYRRRTKALLDAYRNEEHSRTRALEKLVTEKGYRLVERTLGPLTQTEIVPLVDNEPTAWEEIEARVERDAFPAERLAALREGHEALSGHLAQVLQEMRQLQRELKAKARQLDDAMVRPIVDGAIRGLKETYATPKLHAYLDEVMESILADPYVFRPDTGDNPSSGGPFAVYAVNVVVDNSATKGAPVIIETSPTWHNLFGTIERSLDLRGAQPVTFRNIKAGSLLKANDGYLVLNASDVFAEPFVWHTLKRTLRNRVIEIQAQEPYYLLQTTALKPEPVETRAKVVMIGDAYIYHLLWSLDPDFKKIFKVKAEFDSVMDLDRDGLARYVRLIAKFVRAENMLPFAREAVAALVEVSVRMAGQRGRLTTEFNALVDVMREADFLAREAGSERVAAEHVRRVTEERRERLGLIEDKIQELVRDGIILIETKGAVVGQVNGLAVIDLGDFAFGRPSRITARTGIGRAGIVNIEREAGFGGRSHNKGVLILGGFLHGRFAATKPLSLSATLAFEQSYEGVDGDSASSTELYALMSSLADVPLRQDIAVTGSVNQRGEVQAIGGVNHKIEGFFDVCRLTSGLSGSQGVLIPQANIDHLMLREDVVAAVAEGRFHIWPVATIDEGLALLTGLDPGEPGPDGSYPAGTLNRRVDDRLGDLAKLLSDFEAKKPEGDKPATA